MPTVGYHTIQEEMISLRMLAIDDASDIGLRAVLSTNSGTVVEFASHTLNNAKVNYSTTEKECLAIVWAIHKFNHYLTGAYFSLETDHKPLEWLECWSLELCDFQFFIKHKSGTENQKAGCTVKTSYESGDSRKW